MALGRLGRLFGLSAARSSNVELDAMCTVQVRLMTSVSFLRGGTLSLTSRQLLIAAAPMQVA